jgi:hypothetical protein
VRKNFKDNKRRKRRKKASQKKKKKSFKATRAIYIKPIALQPLPTFEELSLYKEERVMENNFFEVLC